MDEERRGGRRGDRLRSFVLGGLVGASAVLATVRRRRQRQTTTGLTAFEQAPCFWEIVQQDRPVSEAASARRSGAPPSSPSAG